MKLQLKSKPREFRVGKAQNITIRDIGKIHLEVDEQLTFVTNENAEYDVCRKNWGYYVTPSVNDRLKRFGFKTALIKNAIGKIFVVIVEIAQLDPFYQYIMQEQLALIHWLDEELTEVALTICPICSSTTIKNVKSYAARPEGENDFQFDPYHRVLQQCLHCNHCFNSHAYDLSSLYVGQYVATLYQNKLQDRFTKIMQLPPEQSDNFQRVKRILAFIREVMPDLQKPLNVLDIGSGLGVFPYKLKELTGWRCVALDPDFAQAEHLRKNCKLEVIHADIMDYQSNERFDLITLNKVLEHTVHPGKFLEKIKQLLGLQSSSAYLYIEIPDGEEALADTPDREEFFIEHFHAFSFSSIQILLKQLAFNLLGMHRIREPSGKYTLYCFAEVKK